jgi:hypothetical protein
MINDVTNEMEWSKGSALTPEQAIELALSDSDRSHNASGNVSCIAK